MVVVPIGIIAVWLFLPCILWFVTGLLSRLHFRTLGKHRNEKSVRPSKNASKANPDEKETSAYVGRLSKQQVRQRVAVINRHLYLVGSFTDYLIGLYRDTPEDLFNKYYSGSQIARNKAKEALEEISNEEDKIKFIEKYFVKPIAYLFLAIMIDQGEKWDQDLKGKRKDALNDLIEKKWGKDYFVFTDRDLKRLFAFCKEQGIDPLTYSKFGLRDFLDEAKRETLQQDWKAVEELIHPIRIWLKEQYKELHLNQPTFPVSSEKFAQSKIVKRVIVLIGVAIFAASYGTLGFSGALFTAAVLYFMLSQIVQLIPFLKFHFWDWFKCIFKIWSTRDNYHGPLENDKAKLQIKRHFFRTYIKYLGAYSLFIVIASLFYGVGTIPLFGLIIGGIPVLLITVRESIRSWWYLFIESAATSLERNQKWDSLKRYRDISDDQLKLIRKPGYFQDAYLSILVKATLQVFHLVTGEQAEALTRVATANAEMPDGLSAQAMEEIVKFLNKIKMVITMSGGT